MNDKKIDQEERQRELEKRKDLEKLIKDTSDEITIDINRANDELPKRKKVCLDYYEVKEEIDNETTNIIISVAEFYLSEEIVADVEYVKQKTKVDHLMVSSLLFQMKTAEHAIIKLLGEIDDGNMSPRMFEVLASLQKSKMEIVKHLAQFMIIMENNYKGLKDDYRIKESEADVESADDEKEVSGFKMRGSRQLLQALHEVSEETTEEDIRNVTKQSERKNNQDNNVE